MKTETPIYVETSEGTEAVVHAHSVRSRYQIDAAGCWRGVAFFTEGGKLVAFFPGEARVIMSPPPPDALGRLRGA